MYHQSDTSQAIVVIDAGTTSIKCAVYDRAGNLLSLAQRESKTFYPRPGWVEQNADDMIALAFSGMREVLSNDNVDISNLIGLCITAQRNTWVPIDRDGNFLTNMFIWQDQRGTEVIPWMLQRLAKYGLTEGDFYKITGQPLSTFQPGSKTFWFKQNRPQIYQKTWKFVTPHTVLSHEFGATSYRDSICDISSWMVADGKEFHLSPLLMEIFDMDDGKYTDHIAPGEQIGRVSLEAAIRTGLPAGLPIFSIPGDQECGVLGVGNYGIENIAVISTGTAGNVIGYAKSCPRHPDGVCQVHGHPAGGYTIEAHSSSCTSSYRWLREIVASKELYQAKQFGEEPNEIISKMILESTVGAGGVLYLPWLQGFGCPYFDDNARGGLIGVSLSSQKEDILRACVEGICFEMRNLLEALQQAELPPITKLKAFGGTSRDSVWNQVMADVMGKPIEIMTTTEATSLGAAIIGFVGTGIFPSYEQAVEQMCHIKKLYIPNKKNVEVYNELYSVWRNCYTELARMIYPKLHELQVCI